MIELRDCPRLAQEALTRIRVTLQTGGQELQRDRSIQRRVGRQIHFTHAAFAEFGGDRIASNGRPDQTHPSLNPIFLRNCGQRGSL